MKPGRPRRPKLRTRVLAGVLAVTLVALVAFDLAAVTALRGYLLNQADARLQAVLSLYRVNFRSAAPGASTPSLAGRVEEPASRRPVRQRVIAGPLVLAPGILGQFYVAKVSVRGPRQVFVHGNGNLVPRVPAALATLARHRQAQTVTSRNGHEQLRLLAETFPGYGTVYATTSLSDVDRTVGQLELILAIGLAAAGLLAAGGVAWVMRRGLRPIETMAAQADAITAGDLASRVSPHDTRTEVGRLGTALNGMLARIDAAVHEREAGQEASRRFFADASHELRTPLASLRANAELYQQGALTRRPQVDEAMHRIAAEAQRMSSLVDDMLRLARLDQHPDQEHNPVDLTALVRECADRAQVADPSRTWRTQVAAGLVTSGDEELLRRTVDNILANVHMHTPPGTVATITAAGRDGTVTVEVSDDGPGVPPDQLPRIFERFYRAAAPSPRPGSGLGLAIVSATAAAHHGTAEATLNHPHGLRITLTCPAPPAASHRNGRPHHDTRPADLRPHGRDTRSVPQYP
jgi:two-component system, OmpR family, sensor kinase